MQMTTDATRNERHATAKAQQASLSMLPAGNAHSGDSDRRRTQPPSTQCHSGRCATCSAPATARSVRSRRWRTVSRRCGASVSTGKVQRATCAVSSPCSAQHAAWRGQLAACITERASRSVAACAGCIRQTAYSMQHSADAFSFAARCLALEEKVHKPSLREHVRPSPLHARAVPPLGHWHKRTASRVIGMGAPRPSCNTAPGLGWAVANPGRL